MGKTATYGRCKKFMSVILVVITLAVMLCPKQIEAAVNGITIVSKDNKVPTYEAGKGKTWTFVVSNNSGKTVNNVTVTPDLGDNNDVWPFKTEMQSYQKNLGSIENGQEKEVSFDFVQREDVPTSRYTLKFKVAADGEEEAERQFYVNTTAKPEEKNDKNTGNADNTGKNTPVKEETNANTGNTGGSISGTEDAAGAYSAAPASADAGGYSNGDAAYSGGTSAGAQTGNNSVPRVIVTGFSTDPGEVHAGSNFKLIIHLKNTAKSKVNNLLFDLSAPTEGNDEQTSAPAFLPVSGSNSIYLESIAANGTADISIDLNAKSDLLQKPYSMDLSMKYEDANATAVEGSSSISIPVKQDARFEFSDFEISQDSIAVGEEANVTCNIYNLGKIKLYNVKAIFEGNHIKRSEVFIGNVESGGTGSIDAMLEGKKISKGPSKVTMTLSYEDEAGNVVTTTKDLKLEVTEKEDDSMMMTEMPEETQKSFPVVPVVIVIIIAAIVAVVVVLKKRKKKKLAENEEEELLDELERSSEDEYK